MAIHGLAELPTETQPEKPLADWNVGDVIQEMQAACADASWFLKQMSINEQTRLDSWDNKQTSGKKEATSTTPARPFNGAADHDTHFTTMVMNKRNAMRVAALSRGALSVTPTEATDAKRAGLMRQVMRYYLSGPMRNEFLTQGIRVGSFADRYRFGLMYVGWKEERGVEVIKITRQQFEQWVQMKMMQDAAMLLPEGMTFDETDAAAQAEIMLMDDTLEASAVEIILTALPGLSARKAEGRKQAEAAVRALRKGETTVTVHGSYVKRSSPMVEALEPFVDVFLPAESLMEDGLESCRWIARVRWRSAQWIKEQAAIHQWNPKWVAEVLTNHKGRAQMFTRNLTSNWGMNAAGVLWGERKNREAQNHLYQIVELWDRSMTSDGLTGTYYTVMHCDVPNMVAERKLREEWDGSYPFVPMKFSMDEKLLLGGLSVPEITQRKQQAIKAQWDSRTDAASFSTFPTWTGDEELAGLRPAPGVFLPKIRGQLPEALKIPPPDGRSIEIEQTVRAAVNEIFSFHSQNVPDAVAMTGTQAEIDWFMASISQVVAQIAKLVQQYMPPMLSARITGTDEMVSASADDVRGSFDFQLSFNVSSMDIAWTKERLGFVKDMILPLDNRGEIDTLPLIEAGFNLFDPSMAARCLPQSREAAQRQTLDMARSHLTDIFTGGAPEITQGMNFAGLAQAVSDEITRSPMRQNGVIGGGQVHRVLMAYLSGLVNNQKQYGGENAATGRTLTEDPLKQPSQAEQLLSTLKELPDGVTLMQFMGSGQQTAGMEA